MKKSITIIMITIISIVLLSGIVFANDATLLSAPISTMPETQTNTTDNSLNTIPENSTITSPNTDNSITPNLNSNEVMSNTVTGTPDLNNNVSTDVNTPNTDITDNTVVTDTEENNFNQAPTVTPSTNSNQMGIDTIVSILLSVVGLVLILLGIAILVKNK